MKSNFAGIYKSLWEKYVNLLLLRWMRFNLISTIRDIYINSNLDPLKRFGTSSRSTTFKRYHSTEHLPIVWTVNGNWDKNMIIRIFQRSEWHCITNTRVRIKKSERVRLWESKSGIPERKLTIWVRLLEIENL